MNTEPIPTDGIVDTRDLDGFMLNAERLLHSELWALATGDEFKAAVTLWCRAWKQVPAGSLPNDDRILASFCHLTPAKWSKVKLMALRGFTLADDGRLYHGVLCAEAKKAWGFKVVYKERIEHDAERKRKERDERKKMFEKLSKKGVVPPWDTTTRELRNIMASLEKAPETPPVTECHSDRSQPVTDVSRLIQDSTGQDSTVKIKKEGTPPPSPVVSSAKTGSQEGTAATAATLNTPVKTGKLAKARKAVAEIDAKALLVAYGCNVTGDRWVEWERDLEDIPIGIIGAILDWRSERGKAIREPSGWRAAKESWDNLQEGSRRELAKYFQALMGGGEE